MTVASRGTTLSSFVIRTGRIFADCIVFGHFDDNTFIALHPQSINHFDRDNTNTHYSHARQSVRDERILNLPTLTTLPQPIQSPAPLPARPLERDLYHDLCAGEKLRDQNAAFDYQQRAR